MGLPIVRLLPVTLLMATALGGCSLAGDEDGDSALPPGKVSVELHLSHATVAQTDYELIKFMGETLYRECGSMKSQRVSPEDREILEVESDAADTIAVRAQEIASLANTAGRLEAPGNNSSVFDPGRALAIIEIGSRKTEIKTSVGALTATGSTPFAASLRGLAKALREAAGGELCGKESFYGL